MNAQQMLDRQHLNHQDMNHDVIDPNKMDHESTRKWQRIFSRSDTDNLERLCFKIVRACKRRYTLEVPLNLILLTRPFFKIFRTILLR